MVKAIQEFGFRLPIIAKSDGTIVDGHLRYKAALRLGLPTVPVVLADGLTSEQIQAFRILVNKSVSWSDWDNDYLVQELGELAESGFPLELTGFTQGEVELLVHGPRDILPELEARSEAEPQECKCPQCGHQFIPTRKPANVRRTNRSS